MIYTLLWKPKACFETYFNKFVSRLTGGGADGFCHSELVFKLTKREWITTLKTFTHGKIAERAKSLTSRINEIFDKADDTKDISLCFYTIWSSEMNLRLLTANDSYVFNRLPDTRYTSSVTTDFSKEEERHALAFCLSELHKKYDNVKAMLFWVPRVGCFRRNVNILPDKYFCSEFVVYCFQQIGYAKNYTPENITPNDLPNILEEINDIIKKNRI
ncbi:MAG: hypothetical protein CMH46_00450 [Muricauda sp.]|nr:hypothetical protein [Allomuricauda sp.]MAU13993.1 hypothetical protein [Allomuricauda sp.]